MTLLHAFARDHIARKHELWVPGLAQVFLDDRWGTTWRESFEVRDDTWVIEHGTTEHPFSTFVPDVLLTAHGDKQLAIEVRYSHAVDEEKAFKFRAHRLECLEFDVSDLAPNIATAEVIDEALGQRERWRWIWNREHEWARSRFDARVGWEGGTWKAERPRSWQAELYTPMASEKLRFAQKRLEWAKSTYETFRGRTPRPTADEVAAWLGGFADQKTGTEERFAIFCAAIGLEPMSLPINFLQKTRANFQRHVYAWQLGIFVAFGFRQEPFTSEDVAAWVKVAMPECYNPGPEWRQRNGFTKNTVAAHTMLLLFEHQGLITSDRKELEKRIFRARFKTRQEFHQFIPQMRAAAGVAEA